MARLSSYCDHWNASGGRVEKRPDIQVGCTPKVTRRHYERLGRMTIARRNTERRLQGSEAETIRMHDARRAGAARAKNRPLDDSAGRTQTVSA